jgi:hypothetical protein
MKENGKTTFLMGLGQSGILIIIFFKETLNNQKERVMEYYMISMKNFASVEILQMIS